MKLDIMACALTVAVLIGGSFLFTGIGHLIWSGYGEAYLSLGASIYPGYHGPGGVGSVLVVTLYGLLDGWVGGLIFAWLYNGFVGRHRDAVS